MLAIAIPMTLANLSQPLMTLAGTMIAGHLETANELAGVSLGGMAINIGYWTFLFLRLSVTGLVSQAVGRKDLGLARDALLRGLVVAVGCGALLLAVRNPLAGWLIGLFGGTDDMGRIAARYTAVRLWSAPAALANFVLVGYLVGSRQVGVALLLQLSINVLNVTAAYLLVFQAGYGVSGIAMGAVFADWSGVFFGTVFILRGAAFDWCRSSLKSLADRRQLVLLLSLNRDLLIRSVALMAANFLIMRASAGQGTAILAANAILLNLNALFTYVIDGFSYAAQTLVGSAIGARNIRMLRGVIHSSLVMAGLVAVALAAGTWMWGDLAVDALTTHVEVRKEARAYLVWLVLLPPAAMGSFVLDGVFIGAVRARQARNSIIISVAMFVPLLFVLLASWGNHGLWAAFVALMLLRGVTLARIWWLLSPRERLASPFRQRA